MKLISEGPLPAFFTICVGPTLAPRKPLAVIELFGESNDDVVVGRLTRQLASHDKFLFLYSIRGCAGRGRFDDIVLEGEIGAINVGSSWDDLGEIGENRRQIWVYRHASAGRAGSS